MDWWPRIRPSSRWPGLQVAAADDGETHAIGTDEPAGGHGGLGVPAEHLVRHIQVATDGVGFATWSVARAKVGRLLVSAKPSQGEQEAAFLTSYAAAVH